MRKTWPHNPRGFERQSWNYRCLQLRHALGWSQRKLARVMGIVLSTIVRIEHGDIIHPTINTIRRIKALESAYEDILTTYKKHPLKNNRLHRVTRVSGGIYLLPVEIRRPEDLETLGKVETDSKPMFFGRGSRKRVQQAGVSMRRRKRLRERSAEQSQRMLKKYAEGWNPNANHRKAQSGQSNDEGNGQK